jgi:putative PIN family toxin of toxin-antitoxin system
VIDPNVFISAAITGRGPTIQLVQAAVAGTVTLVISPLLLQELRKTLERPKFRKYLTLDEAAEFVDGLELLAQIREDPPSTGLTQVCRDPRDDYLVFLAEDVEATLLVSGDKDLLELDRPGLDVRSPADTLNALAYRHPWGPGLIPGESVAAYAQAEAEGHSAVLGTVSAFIVTLGEPEAAGFLPFIVTPESLPSWLNQIELAAELVRGRGLASRPDYPTPNVALVKLPPDPGEHVKATGQIPLPPDTVIVTLQRRPELPQEVEKLGGWRVHAITPQAPTSEDIAGLWRP